MNLFKSIADVIGFAPKPVPTVKDTPPEKGCIQNENGHYVPISAIAELDLKRDSLVVAAYERTQMVQSILIEYRNWLHAAVHEFMEFSVQQYGVKLNRKGNVTLYNYNQTIKIVVRLSTVIRFTEQLQAAQLLVEEWISEKSEGIDEELKLLVLETFIPDKEGNISSQKLFSLMRYSFKGEKWKAAMAAIRDSIIPVDSTQYIRVYERIGEGGKQQENWRMLPVSLERV
jgi:hypothetical protein